MVALVDQIVSLANGAFVVGPEGLPDPVAAGQRA